KSFFHELMEKFAQFRIRYDRANAGAQTCRRTGHRREKYEFLPELTRYVGRQIDIELGGLAGIDERGEFWVRLFVGTAETHGRELAGVLDHTRRSDDGGDVSRTAEHVVAAELRRKPIDVVDAILESNEPAVRAEQRPRCFSRRFGIPQFHGEQHDIDRSYRRWIVGDVRLRQMQIAVNAFDLETVPGNRIAMSAARN